jgi:hypothetical protein
MNGTHAGPLMIGFTAISAIAAPSLRCSISELRESTGYVWRIERVEQMVDSTTHIVRVRAVRADTAAETMTFDAVEWLRGSLPSGTSITIHGIAVSRDDYHDGLAPRQTVRSAGQRGSCFADEYRIGAEYLLLLREIRGQLTPYWWPLGPVNEQLRADDDPWLRWVRERIARK